MVLRVDVSLKRMRLKHAYEVGIIAFMNLPRTQSSFGWNLQRVILIVKAWQVGTQHCIGWRSENALNVAREVQRVLLCVGCKSVRHKVHAGVLTIACSNSPFLRIYSSRVTP